MFGFSFRDVDPLLLRRSFGGVADVAAVFVGIKVSLAAKNQVGMIIFELLSVRATRWSTGVP